MRRSSLLLRIGTLLTGAVALLLGASAARPAASGQTLHHVTGGSGLLTDSARAQALLVIDSRYPTPTVTIISLTGKRLPVPARVRKSPFGLSPDAGRVADTTADGVRVGPVRGGSMKTVLKGDRCPRCVYGTDPSFAWSPDSQRLGAAANRSHGSTFLKLFDRRGRAVRSLTLPRSDPALEPGRVDHHLLSWSPDGSRLLLTQSGPYETAVVVLDLDTGRLRTLARLLHYIESPTANWSPDGRFVAITSHGVQDAMDKFDVIDAPTAQPVIHRSAEKGDLAEAQSPPVWAPDSRSLFGAVFSSHPKTGQPPTRIERFYLTGRRAQVVGPGADRLMPHVALATGLVYSTSPTNGHGVLYLHDFATGHRDPLISPRSGIEAVIPLPRVP